MHEQVREFLRRVRARWPAVADARRVVEFGAYDVNGSAREVWAASLAASPVPRGAPRAAAPVGAGAAPVWVGVDWRPGPGVDVVCLAHEFTPTEDGGRRTEDGGAFFDLAVSTEMLEHDPFWRASLRRMIEVVRPGGCVVVTCAGPERPAHEVGCAPAAEPTTDDRRPTTGPYYQGIGLAAVVQWAQECAGWDVVYGEAHGAPCDTYVALIGRRTADAGQNAPVVSVVVPCVGNVALTRRCVESLTAQTAGRWELALIENGSTPEHREALADVALAAGRGLDPTRNWPERVVFLSWDRMLGYPAAVNRGIQAASGTFVCLLNNDTEIVTPGWDGRLSEALGASTGSASVGASTGGASTGSGGAVIVSPVCDFVANPAQHCQTAAPGRAEAETLCFVAVLMRRELFAQVGLLDEGFGLGNWEDREFCVRAQRAGGRLVVEPAVFVRHAGHGTFRRMRPGVFEHLLRTNERRYHSLVTR
jgi:GT2 family glycosyltransferase/SAM-dependent methyltransferase